MSQKIGPRELALRAQRETSQKAGLISKSEARKALADVLPTSTGRKPVRRKKQKQESEK